MALKVLSQLQTEDTFFQNVAVIFNDIDNKPNQISGTRTLGKLWHTTL